MSWSGPADLRAQIQKLWDRGTILASLVNGEVLFPRRLSLKGPNSSELSDRFEAVRTWISLLCKGLHYRLVMREVRHRILGANAIPDQIWVDTLDDALALIGKCREAMRFAELVEMARARQPLTLPWLAKRPLKALELAEHWTSLLDIIEWLQAHPRPGIYLRQIDLPGIHSKFIEAHFAVLTELLDLAMPPDAFELQATGISRFCRRFGFKDKPLRIRFRLLDPELALLAPGTDQDIAVTQESFNGLELNLKQVFITENEVNFLAFPQRKAAMVIFGAGYGLDALAQADWLRGCDIYYWGDIDTHGFAILDQLRAHLAHAQSFLMDRNTLMAHRMLWGHEPQGSRRDLSRLTEDELSLYDDLRDNRLGSNIRLEQERIGFDWVRTALERLP